MPSVTGKVYNPSKRMKETRAVLDGVAAEPLRIIGGPVQHQKSRCVLPLISVTKLYQSSNPASWTS